MTIREARKEQWESIKDRGMREKLSFFWEYYGIKTICLLLASITLIAFIVSIATKKEIAFTGIFFGAQPQDTSEAYLAEFGELAQIDPEDYELSVQCHLDIQMDETITEEIYGAMESFAAMVATKSVDSFAGGVDLFLYYGYLGYAADLRTVLTEAELTALAPHLHYIDGKVLEQLEDSDVGLEVYPDSTKPEEMADPIPVAVSLNAATEDFNANYHFGEDAVIGICASASYPQNALAFLRYCLIIEEM